MHLKNKSGDENAISINSKYKLSPLLKVDKEDIQSLFSNGIGIYICNFPNECWYQLNNFQRTKNYSIEKKHKFFELMKDGSQILSPTQDSTINRPSKTFVETHIVHLGSKFTGRVAQFFLFFKAVRWLVLNRRSFDYCLVYNFSPVEIFSAFFAKFILRKTIIVDFEDDILLQTNNRFYRSYFSLVKKIPDFVVCINRHMVNYFKKNKALVFNGFIELDYVKHIDFQIKENTLFLYSGALDNIRGIDLVPDLVHSLRKRISNFKILITGSGPLEQTVKTWNFKEVEFLGFLDSSNYEDVLAKADICLVLQKPDHIFSLGSYPSKIEYYSRHKKPIYKIDLQDV